MDVNAPNDYDDDEEEYYEEENEEQLDDYIICEHEHENEYMVNEPTYMYVLGKPLIFKDGKKIGKNKVITFFKKTKNGWISESTHPGFSNKYVSNETWESIEEWLKCDMAGVEVFYEKEEFTDRLNEIVEKHPEFKYSEHFKYTGIDKYEETVLLEKRLC